MKHSLTVRIAISLVPLCLFFLLFHPARAQTPQLKLSVSPADNPLVIRGALDGSPGTFSGNIRLTVSGGDASELLLLAQDLQHGSDSEIKIERTHISIPAGVALTENQPRDIMVTVSQVNKPGVYTGKLRFLLPGQAEADGLPVDIELIIKATPAVTAIYPTESLQLVRCYNTWDCWLAGLVLPNNITQDKFSVFLDNQTDAEVVIESAVVVLKGERTASTSASSNLKTLLPLSLAANRVGELPVSLDRSRFAPDSYVGSLRLSLKDSKTPLLINLDIDVREGPFLALAAIILGMLIGRMARGLESPTGRMQIELMKIYESLVGKLSRMNEPSRSAPLKSLDAWKMDLNAARKSPETLRAEAAALEQRFDLIIALQDLETQLLDPKKAALKGQLSVKIEHARQQALSGELETASQTLSEIAATIKTWAGGQMGAAGGRDENLENTLKTLEESGDKARNQPKITGSASLPFHLRLIVWLTGIQATAEIRYWVIRPLIFLITLLLLALLGLQTLYVNAGATFGVAGLYDYLGLFFWGIGTDVASRSILSLAPKNTQE